MKCSRLCKPRAYDPERRGGTHSARLDFSRHIDVKTSWRYGAPVEDSRRTTIYFDAAVHQALRLKAAATDRPISEMVDDAVKSALKEDAEDLAAFDERKSERSISFESLVRDLRKRGRI
jgi:hypothetical protein